MWFWIKLGLEETRSYFLGKDNRNTSIYPTAHSLLLLCITPHEALWYLCVSFHSSYFPKYFFSWSIYYVTNKQIVERWVSLSRVLSEWMKKDKVRTSEHGLSCIIYFIYPHFYPLCFVYLLCLRTAKCVSLSSRLYVCVYISILPLHRSRGACVCI